MDSSSRAMSELHFSCTNGCITPFDDGHIPLNFRGINKSGIDKKQPLPAAGHIVRHQKRAAPQCLEVFQNVLSEEVVDRIYELGMKEKAWGTYVTLQDARERWSFLSRQAKIADATKISPKQVESSPDVLQELATDAVAQFTVDRAKALIGDDENIHGVAVWVLASDENSEVEYHIDYAELIRYEYNIIVPPLYAGTVQCTSVPKGKGAMVGGAFMVNRGGLKHYERNGYKGRKREECRRTNESGGSSLESDYMVDENCVEIPYKYNQGILHDGDFPHCSTKIESLPPNTKRVIMGFNAFGFDWGKLVESAPEHSEKFNRRVKMYQVLAKTNARLSSRTRRSCVGDESLSNTSLIPLDDIKRNKPLAKLLVLAKREKIKQALKEEQDAITDCLLKLLCTVPSEHAPTVSQLIRLCAEKLSRSGKIPFPDDVHVHINNLAQDETFCAKHSIVIECDSENNAASGVNAFDRNGMILESARLRRSLCGMLSAK